MLKPPARLAGRALAAARIAAEAPGTAAVVREILKRSLGIDALARLPHEARTRPLPCETRPTQARPPRLRPDAGLAPAAPRAGLWTAAAYQSAFREGRATPTQVAERALAAMDALRDRRPTLNILAAADPSMTRVLAQEATARHAAGAPIGPLDGVPILVKDELHVAGLPSRHGSRCSPAAPRPRDATAVARLRAAGAVILGKTVMTEWGMSPLGANVNAAMPHNPHRPDRAAGGSSTGSAVGVALGLAPLALGTDGGGSVRTPASLCGVFGLKPTYGRVSQTGGLIGGSVTHVGPIGASVADLVTFLDVAASDPDAADPLTAWAPRVEASFGAQIGAGVRGLRVGVIEAEWQDASPAIAAACREALRALEQAGAVLVPVEVPLARHAPAIGYLTIGPEVLADHLQDWLERRPLMTDDLRLSMAALSGITAVEQLDAQRLRARLRQEVATALGQVDLLALPTLAGGAPRFTEEDARRSFSDPGATDELCRFAFLGNLTGLPAASAPVGVDGEGVPIGLQLMGDAWDEATVLAAVAHLERTEVAAARRPPGALDLVG